jgi:hypothetical protein
LVLCRVWERTFVLEHLAKIAAIDPASASRAADEMLGFVLGWIAEPLPKISAARNADHR